ncbi:MAG: hypothetical protein RLY32_1028, partial [Pseudomonadota bacterium]
PPPTATQPPPLYSPSNIRTEANCDVVRILGRVLDVQGLPVAGVTMQVGEVGVAGSVFNTAPTDANGRYVYSLGTLESLVTRQNAGESQWAAQLTLRVEF